jgi:hypothetical protein
VNSIYDSHTQSAASKARKSFKTTDLALTMALMVIVFAVSGGIVSEAFQDSKTGLAQTQAEHLAVGLFDPSQTESSNSRSPASFGDRPAAEISMDPWGAPYHYKILKTDTGEMKVVVVSAGPNKKLESNLDKFDTKNHVFGGDDIGFVYDGPNKRTE